MFTVLKKYCFFIFYLDSNGSLFSFTLHWKSGVFSVYSLIFLYLYFLYFLAIMYYFLCLQFMLNVISVYWLLAVYMLCTLI